MVGDGLYLFKIYSQLGTDVIMDENLIKIVNHEI